MNLPQALTSGSARLRAGSAILSSTVQVDKLMIQTEIVPSTKLGNLELSVPAKVIQRMQKLPDLFDAATIELIRYSSRPILLLGLARTETIACLDIHGLDESEEDVMMEAVLSTLRSVAATGVSSVFVAACRASKVSFLIEQTRTPFNLARCLPASGEHIVWHGVSS